MKAIVYVEGKSSSPFEDGVAGVETVESSHLESMPSAVYEDLELIDVLEFHQSPDVVKFACSKIRHGGTLRFSGTDAIEVMKTSKNGRMNLVNASSVLLDGRTRLTSAHELKKTLMSLGMEVKTVSIFGSRYIVEAMRP